MSHKTNIIQAPITKEFIAQFLPHDPVILEAGAHIGRDTLKMANLWPTSKIYAFEPVPELFAILKEKTKDKPNIIISNLALSDKIASERFYVSSGASTAASSLLEPFEYKKKRPEVTFIEIKVKTITIDKWAQENNIDHIDFMWLDMQGNELRALKAAPKMMAKLKVLFVEASLTERFKNNPLYFELRNWIENHGFKPVQEDLPKHDKVNILFVK